MGPLSQQQKSSEHRGALRSCGAPLSSMNNSITHQALAQLVGAAPVPEYRFHATRKWRFDYAWPEQKVALEVDGGAWTQGRHTRGAGFIADQQKRNTAVDLGWRVFHTTPSGVFSGETITFLKNAIRKGDNIE
jgi:hypothetical protein